MIDKNEILDFLKTVIDRDETDLSKLVKTDNEYQRTVGSIVVLLSLFMLICLGKFDVKEDNTNDEK